ncbi:maltooligosyltrehalose trehalohydrolase [Neomicrococcus aestuarii]|uniref:Malto-oligosyltrehalose trehalohydrolase n=1 Tax=Neomicrococcus aestuarii TaxID=556325 RepID=A0A7W8TUB6_9MICC|nr:malto-oligosyltrehalose trehalohydrolase [Neomicrococcus aestuarii]MBB5513030.1 maltooligosyltrehalose trehalohydrolase [Neomicrococcus aestuarii]
MSIVSVWAPHARSVKLVKVHEEGNEALEMTRAPEPSGRELDQRGDGWWFVEVDAPSSTSSTSSEAGPLRYGFIVESVAGTAGTLETPLPDPRSRRQPLGVHGPSERWDAKAFRWTNCEWRNPGLSGGAIYELHLGTFTPEGTLDAAIEKLPYLKDLGITFIELLPVNSFNGTHNWGYDGVSWFAVHEQYGGPEAYQRFVDAAHHAGLGVIQDVVYNHLGPSGNYLPQFGPYLKPSEANTWGDSLNLDGPESDEVRRYIIDNALMWLTDFRVDGLRLDAVHALKDERAMHILEEIALRVDHLEDRYGHKFLIAESDLNNDRLIRPSELGGFGLDGQWDDDYHHAIHANITGELDGYYGDFGGVGALAKTITDGFFHNSSWSSFRVRHHGRPIDKKNVSPLQLVVCIQDHDQIGNRAAGDRWSPALGPDQLILGAALNILSPFTPMLFMGEEFAASTPWQFFTSHPETDLGEAVRSGRFAEFERMGWDRAKVPDPQDETTFRNSVLRWEEANESSDTAHGTVLATYRELLSLRSTTPQLTDPSFASVAVDFSEEDQWLLLTRGTSSSGRVHILFNLSAQPQDLTRVREAAGLSGGVVLQLWTSPNCGGEVSGTAPGFSVVAWEQFASIE